MFKKVLRKEIKSLETKIIKLENKISNFNYYINKIQEYGIFYGRSYTREENFREMLVKLNFSLKSASSTVIFKTTIYKELYECKDEDEVILEKANKMRDDLKKDIENRKEKIRVKYSKEEEFDNMSLKYD
jgi:hypothetical protein